MKLKYLFISLILCLSLSSCMAGGSGIPPLKNSEINGSKTPIVNQITLVNPATTNTIKIDINKLNLKNNILEVKVIIPETKSTITIPEDHMILSTRFLIFWYGTLILLGFGYYSLVYKNKKYKHTNNPVAQTVTKSNTTIESTISTPTESPKVP